MKREDAWRDEDEWKVLAECNAPTKREARVMMRRKFPAKVSKVPGDIGVRPTRDMARLRRGGADAPQPKRQRLRLADGRRLRAGPGPLTPILPAYSPGLAYVPGAYGAGAGRSARGLPILWESPLGDELRGRLWMASPRAVRDAGGGRKRPGSMLADEGLAKKRQEGRT